MAAESTRSRRKEKRIPCKLCVRCGRVRALNEFYANQRLGKPIVSRRLVPRVRHEALRTDREIAAGILLVQQPPVVGGSV